MLINIFKAERDALCFLGLMSQMYAKFDAQIIGPDQQPTHTNGLNILALIIDNATGEVLGMQKNAIHHFNNPLLHAEQLTLKEAIERKNILSPRDPATTSLYYRNHLFNDTQSYDALNTGSTIYTTLEPCPFCTGALLVSRMKRIVFITPDRTYGNSFYNLWSTYYKKYDIHYESLSIDNGNTPLIIQTQQFFSNLMNKIKGMTNIPATLFFDSLSADLQIIFEYFKTVSIKDLKSPGISIEQNTTLLKELQSKIYA
jgi:tRNA(Arg) A34 adenosine deaminase TadA